MTRGQFIAICKERGFSDLEADYVWAGRYLALEEDPNYLDKITVNHLDDVFRKHTIAGLREAERRFGENWQEYMREIVDKDKRGVLTRADLEG
jgi:hypothetical protein